MPPDPLTALIDAGTHAFPAPQSPSPPLVVERPTGPKAPFYRRRPFWTVIGVILVALAAGGVFTNRWLDDRLDPGPPVAGITAVTIADGMFSPASIQVVPGTTVTWTWSGTEEHNVVGDGLESETQSAGTYSYTFTDPGTYDYRCTLHFLMRGRVVVV